MRHAGFIVGSGSLSNYAPASDKVVVMLYNNDVADLEHGQADVLAPAPYRAEN